MHMGVLIAYMTVHCVHSGYLLRPEEEVGAPKTPVTDRCELLYGCWELNVHILEEQLLFLPAKPSLQPKININFKSTDKI